MSSSRKHVLFRAYGLLIWLALLRLSTQACSKGFFGDNCLMKCHCEGGDSNCILGNCKRGCEDGFIGHLCQYKAFPPDTEQRGLWLMDGNPSTCNQGQKILEISPIFQTAVTYMRVTFRKPDLIASASFRLYNADGGRETVMTCSRNQARKVDAAGKIYDIPCFTEKVVHSIIIKGAAVLQLCDLFISPGRNIAPFQKLAAANQGHLENASKAVDGFTYHDRKSLKDCGQIPVLSWGLEIQSESEINMILAYNAPDTVKGLGMFSVHIDSQQNPGKIYEKQSRSYSAYFNIVPEQKKVNVTKLTIHKTDSLLDFHLCEVEILGELRCCGGAQLSGCFETTPPICSKREIKPCTAGYQGDFCEDECPPGYYGLLCGVRCHLDCYEGKCNHMTGDCTECNPGYKGSLCQNECPPDSHGAGCAHRCSIYCRNNPTSPGRKCDHITGKCLFGCLYDRIGEMCQFENCSAHCKGGQHMCERTYGSCMLGCEPGYTGLYCFQECPRGTYGAECSQTCNPNCIHNVCDKVNGRCTHGCAKGFQSTTLCKEACKKGTYGPKCTKKCNSNCKGLECNADTGECIHGCNPGFLAPVCINVCAQNFFGINCEQRCSPSCGGGGCNPVTGKCSPCTPGARGPRCTETCPTGTFGSSCLLSCADHCSGKKTCDAVTGSCTLCSAGKQGPQCNQACRFGTYGEGCNQICSSNCLKGGCEAVNGSCNHGCVTNWETPMCTRCKRGWHGSNCDEHCSSFCKDGKCDPLTGKCYACVKGRVGFFCQDKTTWGISTKNYVIAALVSLALLGCLVMMTYCIHTEVHHRKELEATKQDRHSRTLRTSAEIASGDAGKQQEKTGGEMRKRVGDVLAVLKTAKFRTSVGSEVDQGEPEPRRSGNEHQK